MRLVCPMLIQRNHRAFGVPSGDHTSEYQLHSRDVPSFFFSFHQSGASYLTSARCEQESMSGGVMHEHTSRGLFQGHSCISYLLCDAIQLDRVRQTHVKV